MSERPVTLAFTRRRLPHWRVAGRPYFVTFRLHGTLPIHVISELAAERRALLNRHAGRTEMTEFERGEFRRVEQILEDADNSIRFLEHPVIAALILTTFSFIEADFGWRFPYIVVMPNHVHCLACRQNTAEASLEQALGALKKHTALAGNRILGRHGRFWVDENFDYWCRTAERVMRVREYIRCNPVKAGLVKHWREWKWLRIEEDGESA